MERRERSLVGKRRCGIVDIVLGLWMREEGGVGVEGKDWGSGKGKKMVKMTRIWLDGPIGMELREKLKASRVNRGKTEMSE